MDCWPCEYLRSAYPAVYQDDDVKIMHGIGLNVWGYFGIIKRHMGNVSPNQKKYLYNMLRQYVGDWRTGDWQLEGTQSLGRGHFHVILMPKN